MYVTFPSVEEKNIAPLFGPYVSELYPKMGFSSMQRLGSFFLESLYWVQSMYGYDTIIIKRIPNESSNNTSCMYCTYLDAVFH